MALFILFNALKLIYYNIILELKQYFPIEMVKIKKKYISFQSITFYVTIMILVYSYNYD